MTTRPGPPWPRHCASTETPAPPDPSGPRGRPTTTAWNRAEAGVPDAGQGRPEVGRWIASWGGFTVLSAAAAIALSAYTPPAHAAVLICKSPIVGGPASGLSEMVARRAALDAWIETAKVQHGPGFTSWRLAIAKSVTCRRGASSGYACVALASPCTISQVPPGFDQRPGPRPDPRPDPRRVPRPGPRPPGSKGAIEV